MGKIKQGILGGFKGKVGTVIGASWNGIAYMRGLAQSVKNPKTAAQLQQRAYFKDLQPRRPTHRRAAAVALPDGHARHDPPQHAHAPAGRCRCC